MARIEAPNGAYNGRIGDVVFKDGVAETDNHAVITYCRGAGYTVDGEGPAKPDTAPPVDPRDLGPVTQVGTQLRDAAVDPQPDDFLAPTNAGQADPHGPEVVAPGVHAAPPALIVPGPVLDDPDAQAARETEAAARTLAGDELVPEVTADMAAAADQSAVDEDQATEPPAGNASQEAWAIWVLANATGVDEAKVRAMSRNELRDQYGPKAE